MKQFEGQTIYQVSEYIDPKVKRYGDLAVLTYNYRDAKTKADGMKTIGSACKCPHF